jgi:DNA adenine methylase
MSGTRTYYKSAPFLKWAGGKRWLATDAVELSPIRFTRYYEPFLGSAAMFFGLRPREALLSDSNEELINCYDQIKSDWSAIWNGLIECSKRHSEEFYYQIRRAASDDDRERAIRFLYLNRACFNGIYRVNRIGEFNVPKGSKTVLLYPYDNFEEVSKAITNVDFRCSDFEESIDQARCGDFIFCDPPYTVTHSKNGFIRYNDKLFSWSDQIRLRDALVRADKRGAFTLLSNADFPGICQLYQGSGFRCTPISRRSFISAKLAARGVYGEVLISNYRLPFEEFA